ncbi:MAG: hypothetical protein KGO02_06155 [Alphaproteobacteria bacterium]|nr:hypothetical protein [Alphaproteobacteria bacterium]
MRLDSLEEHLARLLEEAAVASPTVDAAERAELAAQLRRADGPASSASGDPCDRLAAFLDGALDGEDRRALEADLAQLAGEREDLEATWQFLDRVTQNAAAAPEDLLAAALGSLEPTPETRAGRLGAERPARRFWRPSTYGVLGGAACLALAFIAVVPILNEGARAPTKITASSPAPATVGGAYIPDAAGTLPQYIRQPAVLLPSLPQATSHASSDMTAKLGRRDRAPVKEQIAPTPKAPSDVNVAEDNCQTLAGGSTRTMQNGSMQGDKSSNVASADQGCTSDAMVGAQYPGISGPVAPVAIPSLGAVGAGPEMPLPPQGHFRD